MIKSVFVYINSSGNAWRYTVSNTDGTAEAYVADSVPVSIIRWINKADMEEYDGFIWFTSRQEEEEPQSCAGTPLWIEREQYISKQTESAPVIGHSHY